MRQPTFLLSLAAALAACHGEPTASSTDAGRSYAPAALFPQPPGANKCPNASWDVAFQRHLADVLVLFDRSGSMATEFGDGTRFSVAAALLTDLLGAYQDKLHFGFQAFPAKDECAGHATGCCAGPPSVVVGSLQAESVTAAIDDAAPVSGSTPTAEALRLALGYFHKLDDGVADRYLLLATDGRPSCGADGQLADADVLDAKGARIGGACFDAIKAVTELTSSGVKVIVLGIGPGLDDDPGGVPSCLEDLAAQGGLPHEEGQPAFYSGADPSRLESALQQIFAGAARPSCQLVLSQPPLDVADVGVLLDGVEIPRQGWMFSPTDSRTIVITGEYCHRVMRFEVSKLEVRGGACPPCPKAGCE
jgi:hypothetical protein